jgi:hypothetical protein
MTPYSLILFVHVTAVLALFAALAFEGLSLFRLRRASTPAEVRFWIDPVPRLPVAAGGAVLAALLSGVYLTMRVSAFGAAWPKVSLVAMFLIAPMAAISARRISALRRASAAAAAITPDLQRRIHDPLLKLSLGLRIAVLLGIVLLMGAKPDLRESVAAIGVFAVVGVLSARPGSRRTSVVTGPSGT